MLRTYTAAGRVVKPKMDRIGIFNLRSGHTTRMPAFVNKPMCSPQSPHSPHPIANLRSLLWDYIFNYFIPDTKQTTKCTCGIRSALYRMLHTTCSILQFPKTGFHIELSNSKTIVAFWGQCNYNKHIIYFISKHTNRFIVDYSNQLW